MKNIFASLATLILAAAFVPQFSAAQPAKAEPEPLPDAPKLDAKNNHVALSPDKSFLLEQTPDKKFVRVLIACEVCLREGPLEVFLTKKGTKEHEAIVRTAIDAKLIHAAIEATGAKPGKPANFVDDKFEPDFKPATGARIKVLVHYKKDGKLHTSPAQEWIWNSKKKEHIKVDWVFAGSQLLKDADNPKAEPFYGANSGEVISVSNFPYSMLDLPIEVSKDDATLNYEVKTERVPPLFSKVWVILEPATEKK
jgi:hypothetical protein